MYDIIYWRRCSVLSIFIIYCFPSPHYKCTYIHILRYTRHIFNVTPLITSYMTPSQKPAKTTLQERRRRGGQ